jgi:hypothetical protein
MSDISGILKLATQYEDGCQEFIKDAIIRKQPNGKYRVLSEKGKNLGESDTRSGAEKRLKQVEFFKHKDKNQADDSELDLSGADDWSYSAIMRKLREKGSKEQVMSFLKIYKNCFDRAVKEKLQKPEKVALQNAAIKFSKVYKIKFSKKLVKKAAVAELGDPALVGQYLANIVKFTLNRISPEKRTNAIANLRNKLYFLNERELADKKMPASSAIGQSITFVKTVLFNHDKNYIREVLNHLVRAL